MIIVSRAKAITHAIGTAIAIANVLLSSRFDVVVLDTGFSVLVILDVLGKFEYVKLIDRSILEKIVL